MKIKCEKKNFLYLCRANNSSSFDMNIDSIGITVSPLVYLPRTPFISFHVNASFSLKKTENKYTTVTLVIFRFNMCPQIFITLSPMTKKIFGSTVPLKKRLTTFHLLPR